MPQIRLRRFSACLLAALLLWVKICNSLRSGEEAAMAAPRGFCSGDCEEIMDSESSRRVLVMQRRYISYATLLRDLVPCNRPGASYYNCKAGPAVANSYNRGCEIITRCARGY
ncbi:protein RALF-like 24 [Andrographis paniculata]|uniref:protein RALF-like 24 n=1 Tax=Andrographis paniculata TaxID=175694 RepID=UPI0021E816E0|nr:protein RALF-like 24 [Andrographis paniculata]